MRKVGNIYKTCRKSENFSRNIDRNFSVLTDSLIGDTSLYYRQELSVALSIGIKSSYAIYFWRPYFWEANFTSNWLCSKLLVTYPDRGGQAKHFWHFLFLLSFLSQLSSVQLRDISAKFYINIFYLPWPPLTVKTLKNFCVSQYYTSALGSTVKRSSVYLDKWVNSQIIVKWTSLSTIWKLPWSMTINSPTMQSQ